MLRHATRLLHGLLAVGLLLGLAPSARAAATYDVTQVGDVGFSQVWNATGNKEVKSGDTIGFNPWSVHITLEGHIDDISALAAGDVVSVPLTSDAGSHFSMNGTGWECADDVATSDGTVAFKANMRDGRADLRLTRTAARLSGRFDFRVVIRNGNLWYADRKSTSSTWHAGSDTFAFHNTTKPNHRCVNDTTGVGVNSTKSGVGASMVTWNCATVNRIARGGAESDTAPDVTYHIHVASADEGHPVTVASGTRAFEAYHAYDGTTAGDAFTGPGGGSHVAYTPKRTDGTPTAGEYRLVANADGSYDYDLDIGPREGANANRFTKPAVDATTAELMEASNMLFQVDYGGISINFDSSTEKRSAVVTKRWECPSTMKTNTTVRKQMAWNRTAMGPIRSCRCWRTMGTGSAVPRGVASAWWVSFPRRPDCPFPNSTGSCACVTAPAGRCVCRNTGIRVPTAARSNRLADACIRWCRSRSARRRACTRRGSVTRKACSRWVPRARWT